MLFPEEGPLLTTPSALIPDHSTLTITFLALHLSSYTFINLFTCYCWSAHWNVSSNMLPLHIASTSSTYECSAHNRCLINMCWLNKQKNDWTKLKDNGLEMKWKGGPRSGIGSVTTGCRGSDISSFCLSHHQLWHGRRQLTGCLVGSRGQAVTSGRDEMDAAPQ